MKQIVLCTFALLFARTVQVALSRDKFLTKDGELSALLTLKDSQGGFVGTNGLIWTVHPDGSWDRKRFINRTIRKADMQGKLSAKELQALADVLAHAQVDKLPSKIGKFRGANPHVVTLSWGKHQCVWTLPPGSPVPKYPDQPFGKLAPEDGFSEIFQKLGKILKKH
ncbi:MAG: hypothetical protein QF685_10545 [Verrucomicrobiota bacterium]|jgi:hypothetical protein|nr:hypothetical protein [Verrucomicrobiota bacterium]